MLIINFDQTIICILTHARKPKSKWYYAQILAFTISSFKLKIVLKLRNLDASQCQEGWKTPKSKSHKNERERYSPPSGGPPLFLSSFNYKVINVHPLSVARLTIPDGKLQLYVIPFYTRQNPLVSVQNVLTPIYIHTHTHVRSYIFTRARKHLAFIFLLRLTISFLEQLPSTKTRFIFTRWK